MLHPFIHREATIIIIKELESRRRRQPFPVALHLSQKGAGPIREASFLTKGVPMLQTNEIHLSFINSFFYFLCAKHKDYWDEEVWFQPSRAHHLLRETDTSTHLPCLVTLPAAEASGGHSGNNQARATRRGSLDMFSANMRTSLKMCYGGSGGQVDVIILFLERERKKKTNPEI